MYLYTFHLREDATADLEAGELRPGTGQGVVLLLADLEHLEACPVILVVYPAMIRQPSMLLGGRIV